MANDAERADGRSVGISSHSEDEFLKREGVCRNRVVGAFLLAEKMLSIKHERARIKREQTCSPHEMMLDCELDHLGQGNPLSRR